MLTPDAQEILGLYRSLRTTLRDAANAVDGLPRLVERLLEALEAGRDTAVLNAKIQANLLRMNVCFSDMQELQQRILASGDYFERVLGTRVVE